MKSFEKIPADFNSEELDASLERWLSGRLTEAERQEWLRALDHRSRLREDFADWVKSLREPGWSNPALSRKSS